MQSGRCVNRYLAQQELMFVPTHSNKDDIEASLQSFCFEFDKMYRPEVVSLYECSFFTLMKRPAFSCSREHSAIENCEELTGVPGI